MLYFIFITGNLRTVLPLLSTPNKTLVLWYFTETAQPSTFSILMVTTWPTTGMRKAAALPVGMT